MGPIDYSRMSAAISHVWRAFKTFSDKHPTTRTSLLYLSHYLRTISNIMIIVIILNVIVIKLFIIYMCFPYALAGAVGELCLYIYSIYIYIYKYNSRLIYGVHTHTRVKSLGESYSDFATWAAYQVPPRVCFLYLFTSRFTARSLPHSIFVSLLSHCQLFVYFDFRVRVMFCSCFQQLGCASQAEAFGATLVTLNLSYGTWLYGKEFSIFIVVFCA